MPRLVPTRLIHALRAEATTHRELPPELARDARRRVRIAAAIGALSYLVFTALEWTRIVNSSSIERLIDANHNLLGMLLCSGLLLITAIRSVPDQGVLTAALLVEVLLAAVISLHLPWAAYLRTGYLQSLTWVALIIVLFPLLVPTPPATTLAVSILCALTAPVGMWLLDRNGAIHAVTGDYVSSAVTNAIAVGIAVVASNTIYRAGREVAAARRIGSYELLDLLGQGGMGQVWKARHSMLARPAAVKLILPESLRGEKEERDSVVARFTREAQLTANLRSPHTVQLFDFGVSTEGTFYYAMELLDGMNAEHFVYRHGALPPGRAAHWLRQACHSLREAHALGLVHRDIKPANLFVCRYGLEVDFVKLLDFGLVKPATQADPTLTQAGTIMGTPGYMAPEQMFGLPATPQLDVYALGCVGYWLLAGAKPFDAESAGEMMRLHVQADPPPLSRPGRPVAARFEALILACLAKKPGHRPAGIAEIDRELAACADEAAPWTAADAEEWWSVNAMTP